MSIYSNSTVLTNSRDFIMWNFKILDICATIQTMKRSQLIFIKKNNTEIFQIFTVDSLNVIFLKQRTNVISGVSMAY